MTTKFSLPKLAVFGLGVLAISALPAFGDGIEWRI